jgi:hypothetical protein
MSWGGVVHGDKEAEDVSDTLSSRVPESAIERDQIRKNNSIA